MQSTDKMFGPLYRVSQNLCPTELECDIINEYQKNADDESATIKSYEVF